MTMSTIYALLIMSVFAIFMSGQSSRLDENYEEATRCYLSWSNDGDLLPESCLPNRSSHFETNGSDVIEIDPMQQVLQPEYSLVEFAVSSVSIAFLFYFSLISLKMDKFHAFVQSLATLWASFFYLGVLASVQKYMDLSGYDVVQGLRLLFFTLFNDSVVTEHVFTENELLLRLRQLAQTDANEEEDEGLHQSPMSLASTMKYVMCIKQLATLMKHTLLVHIASLLCILPLLGRSIDGFITCALPYLITGISVLLCNTSLFPVIHYNYYMSRDWMYVDPEHSEYTELLGRLDSLKRRKNPHVCDWHIYALTCITIAAMTLCVLLIALFTGDVLLWPINSDLIFNSPCQNSPLVTDYATVKSRNSVVDPIEKLTGYVNRVNDPCIFKEYINAKNGLTDASIQMATHLMLHIVVCLAAIAVFLGFSGKSTRYILRNVCVMCVILLMCTFLRVNLFKFEVFDNVSYLTSRGGIYSFVFHHAMYTLIHCTMTHDKDLITRPSSLTDLYDRHDITYCGCILKEHTYRHTSRFIILVTAFLSTDKVFVSSGIMWWTLFEFIINAIACECFCHGVI
jgi:hypothetical protein